MKISVFGLGYVGSVTAACLSKLGHNIVGIDVVQEKVRSLRSGEPPVLEAGLADILKESIGLGRMDATMDGNTAVQNSDVSIVCVPTPSGMEGEVDLSFLEHVSGQIGDALRGRDEFHTVIIRSTVPPGTIRELVIPRIERTSKRTYQESFGVCHNPEFLREGVAISDFFQPARTVLGVEHPETERIARGLYVDIEAPFVTVPFEVSEMIKYADNTWHALKVTFANELGRVCKATGVDSRMLHDVFIMDDKLNISSAYLSPGFAFGGSCLPKDVRALSHMAQNYGVSTPVFSSIMESNEDHLKVAVDLIRSIGIKEIGVLGLTFKAGTDDLRESPVLKLVQRLVESHDLRVFEPSLTLGQIVGSNKRHVLNSLPNVCSVLCQDPLEVIETANLLVIGNQNPEFADLVRAAPIEIPVLDLVGLVRPNEMNERVVYGIV